MHCELWVKRCPPWANIGHFTGLFDHLVGNSEHSRKTRHYNEASSYKCTTNWRVNIRFWPLADIKIETASRMIQARRFRGLIPNLRSLHWTSASCESKRHRALSIAVKRAGHESLHLCVHWGRRHRSPWSFCTRQYSRDSRSGIFDFGCAAWSIGP
jgi:hypothetical protein